MIFPHIEGASEKLSYKTTLYIPQLPPTDEEPGDVRRAHVLTVPLLARPKTLNKQNRFPSQVNFKLISVLGSCFGPTSMYFHVDRRVVSRPSPRTSDPRASGRPHLAALSVMASVRVAGRSAGSRRPVVRPHSSSRHHLPWRPGRTAQHTRLRSSGRSPR